MPNKERTPLQEIMNTVESGFAGFGLPPLPPLSKLVPGTKGEKPKEANHPVIPFITDVREIEHPEPDVLGVTTKPEFAHIDYDSAKMNVYGSKRL